MDKFVIIDGNSLINRAFYALPMLTNFEGEISNAVFGFTTILVKIINEIKPKYIAVAFDFGKKTFRNDIYKEYKGTRKPTPDDLKSQFPILKNLLNTMGIKYIEKQGIEADDIIGTLSKKFETENIIVTGDKDSFQLINNNTWVMFTKKGITETVNYNLEQLKLDYGIEPYQIVELKSLMGDASDNIPGVKGIGEKTALFLLEKYETLEGVYSNLDNIVGKLKEKLEESKENAFLSKTLATINCECDLNVNLEEFTYKFPFNNDVLKFFKRYQFNSLLRRKELFVLDEEPVINQNLINYEQIEIKEIGDIKSIVYSAKQTKQMYIVLEDILSIFVDDKEYYLSNNYDLLSSTLELNVVLNELKEVLENENIKKCVYNYKDMLHKFYKYGINLKGVNFDVLIARYLINNIFKANVKFSQVVDENQLNEHLISSNLVELKRIFGEKLKLLNMENLFYEIEMPLSEVLFNMEICGFKIDEETLKTLDIKYEKEISDLVEIIYELAGTKFNINSPKQLGEILFDKLKLVAFNNKKNSTSIDVLTEISSDHPIVEKIIRYRQITKLYTTYIKAFENLIDKNTQKIYTIFNQTLTATGRLSSSEPNLQNIPVRSEEGRLLRKVFVPSNPMGYIVSADYSQIELRLLAAFSEDPTMITNFIEGKDIHTATASQVFGVKLSDVTSQMRRDAKAINFGIIYGISDYGLSQNINSTRKVAKDYIDRYFEKYPQIKEYMDSNIAFCKNNGFVKTLFNRIRYIPEINSSNYNLRTFGERAAMNMPLQGSASDIIKVAMIKVSNKLQEQNLKSKLILQIHDELIIDCEPDELNEVTKILKDCMENVVQLKVKLEVNISYGSNWYEAK